MVNIVGGLYRKAAGISMVLHGVLFVCILCIGQAAPAVVAPPAVVEIVPASILEMGVLTPEPAVVPSESAQAAAPVEAQQASQLMQTDSSLPQVIQSPAGEAFLPRMPATGTNEAVVLANGSAASAADQNNNSQAAGTSQPTSASVLRGAPPGYPNAARKEGWEGTVVVRVLIDTDGSVKTVTVRQSSGYGIFDDTAVRAVAKWRFSPATQGGKPITSFYDVKVKFCLTDPE